jgi:hypothetical protein
MDLSLVVPAIVFLALGASIVGYLIWVLFTALAGNTRGWGETARFRRKEQDLKNADKLLELKDWSSALAALEGAFFFDQVRTNEQLIEKSLGHNLSVLTRLLSVAEGLDRSVSNAAILEDLVESRCDLMRAFFEAANARETLKKSRKRQVPRWAFEEYDKKLLEIADRLTTNRKTLESQIKITFVALRTQSRAVNDGSEITIH